jgi:hypothetical protein
MVVKGEVQQRLATVDGLRLFALALAVGEFVGVATDLLQAHLSSPWLSLVNSASPWLAPAFAVGIAARHRWHAVMAGLAVCEAELFAYGLTAQLRHIPVSSSMIIFWAVCGTVGGPLLGLGGRLWHEAKGPTRGLGPALLVSAFLAEAMITYAAFLHYYSSAALFAVIGIALAAALGVRGRQYARTGLWMLGALPAAVLAEVGLHVVYSQA